MKQIDLTTAATRLLNAGAVRILAHSHPDGDTLGSAFALAHALHSLGKEVHIACEDTIPAMFDYMALGLPYSLEQTPLYDEAELLVCVDIANESLLGERFAQAYQGKVDLNIDHHSSNALYAAENLVDNNAAACAEVVSDLIDRLGVPITTQIAACLYAGISTDTGCFRYANTTARSHRCAARYIDLGVITEPLDRAFFETETKAYLALERMAFDGLRYYCNGRVALTAVTQEMFNQSGSNEEEYIKLVARMRQIEGVLVGVAIRERHDGSFKISMRTHEPVNASAVASRMGGGGHLRAAGCASDLPLEETIEAIVGYICEALPPFLEDKA